jgi:hypothetical protein
MSSFLKIYISMKCSEKHLLLNKLSLSLAAYNNRRLLTPTISVGQELGGSGLGLSSVVRLLLGNL